MRMTKADLSVTFLLVGAGKLAAAGVASERLFARVRPYVRRQVVRPRKPPHANATLERFLSFKKKKKEKKNLS